VNGVAKRVASILFAVFVAAGLTFGATQALNVTPAAAEAVEMIDNEFCGDDFGEYDGYCPDNAACERKCNEEHGFGGACIITEEDGPCCICQV
jgi:hypothetical protein